MADQLRQIQNQSQGLNVHSEHGDTRILAGLVGQLAAIVRWNHPRVAPPEVAAEKPTADTLKVSLDNLHQRATSAAQEADSRTSQYVAILLGNLCDVVTLLVDRLPAEVKTLQPVQFRCEANITALGLREDTWRALDAWDCKTIGQLCEFQSGSPLTDIIDIGADESAEIERCLDNFFGSHEAKTLQPFTVVRDGSTVPEINTQIDTLETVRSFVAGLLDHELAALISDAQRQRDAIEKEASDQ